MDPKERTTERVDLSQENIENDPQLKRVMGVLQKKRKIVVIAGAGISVSAGIPDFRSSGGLFNSLRKQHKLKSSGKDLFDASVYQDDSSTSSFHDMVRSLSQKTKNAQPTAFHHLLATLAQEGRLLRLYTQNVDGIDTSLPPLKTQVPLPKKAPWPKTIQLHGGLDHMVCSKCHTLSEFDAEQFNGPVPPACGQCTEKDNIRRDAELRSHGIGRLRPRMVLYNEHNPDDEAIGSCASLDLRTRPDAVIVVGTTLKVPGIRRIAREMCAVVRDRRDGVSIWINNDPEPIGKDLANSWDIVVKGPCDEIARHAAMPRWDVPNTYKEVTEDELNKKKDKQTPVVMVPSSQSTPKKTTAVLQVQGQTLTPAQSPRIKAQPASVQDPATPTKAKGKKRKSDASVANETKAKTKAPTKRQPKKAAPKGKPKGQSQKMTMHFGVSKSKPTKESAVTKKSASFIHYDPKGEQIVTEKTSTESVSDTIMVQQISSQTVTGSVTGLKTAVMANIPPGDARVNATRPELENFTPTHQRTSPPILVKTEVEERDESRPSTASSVKSETIIPIGPVPRDFRALLDMIAP
jgi:NAD-dependent histone deacetylase SIR2